MHDFAPYPGLHVVLRTKSEAERHERQSHNIPPDVGLGWQPYTVIVTSAGGSLPHSAFHGVRPFKAWLGDRYGVKLSRAWRGVRFGKIVAK